MSEHQPKFQNLLKQYCDIFEGQGKFLDYEVTRQIDESIQPISQAGYRYPYPLLQSINDKLKIEAVVHRRSSKLVFLKISQHSQKNICVGVFF